MISIISVETVIPSPKGTTLAIPFLGGVVIFAPIRRGYVTWRRGYQEVDIHWGIHKRQVTGWCIIVKCHTDCQRHWVKTDSLIEFNWCWEPVASVWPRNEMERDVSPRERIQAGHRGVWADHRGVWADHRGVWADHRGVWADHRGVWAGHRGVWADTCSRAVITQYQH